MIEGSAEAIDDAITAEDRAEVKSDVVEVAKEVAEEVTEGKKGNEVMLTKRPIPAVARHFMD